MFTYKYRNITIAAFVLVFLIGFYFVVSFALFLYSPASMSKDEAIVDIPSGTTFRAVTHLLYDSKLLKNEKKFLILARLRHAGSKIKSGELRFYKNMTPLQVLDNLLNGVPVTYAFTVPEGFNIYQIGQVLEEKGIIKHASSFISECKNKKTIKELGIKADSVEGYLFPETYVVEKVRDVKSLIKIMNKKYKEVFTQQLIEKSHEIGLTEHEVITLASIVEKETGAVEERKKVASVFFNRLKKGMRLQSDPTTIYGMWETYKGNLSKDDLQKYTPYNTYKVFGIPVGPIASPGKDSIMAVLYPEKTDYFFFVSKNDGTHVFTADYGNHQKAVNKFQKDSKSREGKSWRDLSKKTQAVKK
ncbi:MAG: endolytic transglycosylase MltG [bacterium]